MAIQIPNPGTGNGASGDNEFVLWSKVKDNFSDQTHAASKLIGTTAETVTLNKNLYTAIYSSTPTATTENISGNNVDNLARGSVNIVSVTVPNSPEPAVGRYNMIETVAVFGATPTMQRAWGYELPTLSVRSKNSSGVYGGWAKFYSTQNTTKDSNGFIKAASPIVKVHADKVELNEEAEQQNVTYKKNGIGDYTITTVSGLSTDGWYIELPKDMNGNPKVAVTLTEVDGVISLKSYKRIFSMETFTFVPDLNEPLDIPDTRWIDLRLNEILLESSEPETEV